ncbi:MAG TPA: protein kinase [Vicinamibacterales bacterium]|nr:protein kinase [Vicinamibacterales bacterium]
MADKVISHYRLLHRLGEGGMGVVYRAEDLQLGREVAIKLLRADEAHQEQWLMRFEREARLASALQHPHICTIHELGQHEGIHFIVMELLEGRTIKQILGDGPLPIGRALDFAIQIASALEAAHGRDIVHRDIKPANLFVTHGDRVKVLDFGLAKLAGPGERRPVRPSDPTMADTGGAPDVTTTGVTVGTAAYMSPEQATGDPIDARTDIFSFGSVLYEMVTARRAFPGDSTALVMMRLLSGEIVPPRAFNPDVPERLEAVILKALHVAAPRRYQTASELLADLRSLARDLLTDASGPVPVAHVPQASAAPALRHAGWRPARWAAAILMVAVAALAAWRWLPLAPHRPALTDRDSIVIGSFANNSDDPVFDEALTTALRVQLGQSPFLDIVGDGRIAETLRSMGQASDTRLTSGIAREVCQRLGATAMLEGSIATLGTNYVLTLTATDCRTGESVARAQQEVPRKEQVLTVLGSLSSSIRTRLGESLPSLERFDVPIEQATTPSLGALKAYALGLAERRRGRELESVAFFNQAIELDPEFAAAYTTLSTVYGSLGEWKRSEEYAKLAYARHKRVSERERLFITYQYHERVTGDQQQAAEALEIWKVSYPRDVRPANALAVIHNRFGRYEQAVAEATEALRRSPGHPFPMSNLAVAYRGLGRYDEARRIAEEAVALGVATTPTRRLLYQLGVLAGDGSAAAQLAWARDRPREFDMLSGQAQVAVFEGRLRNAVDLYTEAADKAAARGLEGTSAGFWAHLAWIEACYGDPRTAPGRVRQMVERMSSGGSEGTLPRFRAAAALALVGHADAADAIVAEAQARYPESTFVRTVLVPAATAATALARRRPADAVAALDAAMPTEWGTVAALVPTFLRAEALLAQGQPAAARREYLNLLDHRGSDPFAPVVPLAYLGIARAWTVEGDPASARRAYDELFRIWERADPDLPVLARARAERARLAAGSSVPPS